MIETLTLITLCVLYLVFFWNGKMPPLDNQLVILRPGKYQVTLAPKLNLAQPFIEAAASQLLEVLDKEMDSNTLYFQVSDKQVAAHGNAAYLLAVTWRNQMLYCQAVSPAADQPDYATISQAAQGVLLGLVAVNPKAVNQDMDAHLRAVIAEAAQVRGIAVSLLAA
jgi:regulator of protease activity HflC (stomatin/prohibitin superfamily)